MVRLFTYWRPSVNIIYVIEGEPESGLSVTNVNEIFINIRL